MFRLLGLLLLASQAVFGLTSIKNCGTSATKYTLNSAAFWPDPPIAGENATLSFLYTVPEGAGGVSDGTASYSTTLNYIPLPTTTNPLCADVTCPIDVGQHNLTSTAAFPSGVSGKLVEKIQWLDTQNNQLLCVQLTMAI